jgi:uncharacterized membrane protein YccC
MAFLLTKNAILSWDHFCDENGDLPRRAKHVRAVYLRYVQAMTEAIADQQEALQDALQKLRENAALVAGTLDEAQRDLQDIRRALQKRLDAGDLPCQCQDPTVICPVHPHANRSEGNVYEDVCRCSEEPGTWCFVHRCHALPY